MSDESSKAANLGRCPICKSKAAQAFRPFCSKKCSDIDLNRWLSESYVIASSGADADEDGDDARIGQSSNDETDTPRKH